jgi:ribosomal subunit interface protein
MNLTIEAPFKMSESDREAIESKINYLDKFEPRMTQVNVFFKEDDGLISKGIRAEIRIRVPGNDLFADATDKDAIKAFSSAYSSIKRLAKKRRDKMNDHQSPVKKMNDIVNDNL